MAQATLFGTDASLSTSGYGCRFNSFTVNITQGVTEAYGFGSTWVERRGTILGATGEMSGFLTKGTANDVIGISAFTRTGASTTFTYATGCTLAFTAILTGIAAAAPFLGTSTSGYSYASTGAVTETWAAS